MAASAVPSKAARQAESKPVVPPIMQQGLLTPWLYLAPAVLIITIFVIYPTLNTVRLSFLDANGVNSAAATCRAGQPCWGIFENYRHALTDAVMLLAFRNNLMWIVLMVSMTVGLGLVIAVLADRVKYEALAKALIFMPMAISFVSAAIIWGFIYDYQSQGQQIGLLNAIVTALDQDPIPWLTTNPYLANVALIVVGIWVWTGFCMTILSAAIKGVPGEVIEAARVDGASEWQLFRGILVPLILPTIVVVVTTMIINVLKIFDIVYVMGRGQPQLQVMATRMYQEQFIRFDAGYAAAISVILILVILPVGYLNIRRFREQEARR